MPTELVWEEPPPRRIDRGPGSWVSRLLPLMERPGHWARVKEYDSHAMAAQIVSALRRRKCVPPAGQWEFTSRAVDGKGYVYARYLGPNEDVA